MVEKALSGSELTPSQKLAIICDTAINRGGKGCRTNFYNLDAIIAVGYRVKFQRGTQFRILVTQRLSDEGGFGEHRGAEHTTVRAKADRSRACSQGGKSR